MDDGEPDTAGRTVGTAPRPGPVAFVLGGGGLLGASEIGMLRALFEAGRRPDLVVGTSVGALNGALVAADPTPASLDRLVALWRSMSTNEVFSVGLARLRDVARHRTHLHPITPLRDLVDRELGHARIEDLAVPFQCCAASIERAAETWFSSGPVSAAVTASCAVPGLFPPVRIGDEHFLDGGIVNSIPVGRAIELGATTVYVLHVGRISQPLAAPTRPWEVAMVAFEIARRHRFARDMAEVPDGVAVHVLPAGDVVTPTANLRYRDTRRVTVRTQQAYQAARAYLATLDAGTGTAAAEADPGTARAVRIAARNAGLAADLGEGGRGLRDTGPVEAGSTEVADAGTGRRRAADARERRVPGAGEPGATAARRRGATADGAGEGEAGDDRASTTAASDTRAGDTRASTTPASDTRASTTPASDTRAGDTRASTTPAGDTRASTTPAGDTRASTTPAGDDRAGEGGGAGRGGADGRGGGEYRVGGIRGASRGRGGGVRAGRLRSGRGWGGPGGRGWGGPGGRGARGNGG